MAHASASRRRSLVLGLVALALAVAGAFTLWRWQPRPAPLALTAEQRAVIDELVSVLQFDNALLQYGYVENRRDGAGFTAGRNGFTTAGGAVAEVLAEFTGARPASALVRYLPAIRALGAARSDDVNDLDGFEDAWRHAAADPVFRAAQDHIGEQRHASPALDRAHRLGLRTPLGYAALYDAVIQHGTQDDTDGVDALITTATAAAHGTPDTGVTERAWLTAFLNARAASLRQPHDPRRTAGWIASTGRIDALNGLLNSGNLELHTPFAVSPYGVTHVIFPLAIGAADDRVLLDAMPSQAGATSPAASTGPSAPSTAPPAPAQSAAPSAAQNVVKVATVEGLRTALAAARPGQTIQLADGTYAGAFTAATSGTAQAPITLSGSPRAVLTSGGYGFHLTADHWNLTGFTIAGAAKGLVLDGAHRNVIDGLTVQDIRQEGIHLRTNSTDNVVKRSRIGRTGDQGLVIGNAAAAWPQYTGGNPDRSDRNTITGNTFGPDTARGAITVYEGTAGGTLSGNSFNGAGITQGGAWVLIRGNGYQVTSNSGSVSPSDGYQVRQQPGQWGCGTVFRGNRLDVRAAGYGIWVKTEAGCATTVSADNVALNAGSGLTNVAVQR
ncbi:chitosanase [Dactylosporangium sp. AC04546]|uniref:chitosanase n=1 Tax=Dactylosporangium sp. AC04546 TaxID=2862460 RepID=UPI001EDF7737|nr:chitosanase [Dactylosporangium sp. AC04546]WVK86675.1 chitosanase [Dactylosporangium sp. AC04546]